jgi:hypothetical protein
LAHDRRTGNEPWAWLAAVPDEDLDRDLDRVRSSLVITLVASSLPSLQRAGDLVVYCRTSTGAITGIGEVAGAPHRKDDDPANWRIRVRPHLLLDRGPAPLIAEAGMRASRLQTQLEPDQYLRLRELALSAAVPLQQPANQATTHHAEGVT